MQIKGDVCNMKRKLSMVLAVASVCALSMAFNVYAEDSTATETTAVTEEAPMGEMPEMNMGTMAKVVSVSGTTISVQEAEGQRRGGNPGGMAEGEAPELPEGMTEGEAPEKPEGEAPEMPAGEAPEKPEGMPEGEAPEKPEGMAEGEAPEKPEGMTEGEAPGQPGEMAEGEKPEMTFEGEEKTITVDESILYKEGENGEKVQAAISDVTVDTVLSITYGEDGVTPTEIVIKG